MEFKDNLIRLRKERGWSQEELGYQLDVSRQTVSKWESGATSPEMGKLTELGRIFDISLDELVKGEQKIPQELKPYIREAWSYEYKSKRTFRGIPLVHVNLGKGLKLAKGIVAVGNISIGVVSVGAVSAGVITIGAVSIGIIALAAFALGILSMGAITAGVISMGGIAAGYLALGGIAKGTYAIGGLSIAERIAIGGYAAGHIAIGETANGVITFVTDANFKGLDGEAALRAIRDAYPQMSGWIYGLMENFLR